MRLARSLSLVLFALASSIVAPSAHAAPSFDCRRAKALVEKQICGSAEFESLDRAIADLFKRGLTVLSKDDATALRDDQRAWVKERDACEDYVRGNPPVVTDVLGCMRTQMGERKEKLEAILARKRFAE